MDFQPTVFILIPVYNVEKYLDDCLNSILQQTYTNYEVVLVNDGSTDSSGAICDEYSQKHSCIHVVHKANGGSFSARIAAIEHVKNMRHYQNTYCIFVDSDDLLKKDALEVIVKNIRSSSCDMLIFGYETFNENGIIYSSLCEGGQELKICEKSDLFREALIEHTYNSMCRKAIRTELLFVETDPTVSHIQMGEDLIQSTQIYILCNVVQVIPDVLYRYRTTPGSATHTIKIKKYTDDLSSREFAIQIIRDHDLWMPEDYAAYQEKCLSAVLNHIREILSRADKRNLYVMLQSLRMHAFFVDFCASGINKNSHLLLKLFLKKSFRKMHVFWKINRLKNKLLRG